MRVLFIGTVNFSLQALKKIISLELNIVGVCTKRQSKFNSDFENLVPICESSNIPYYFASDINSSESINWIKDKKPDVIFCFGWSSLIKKELLNLTDLGVIGYHPAELPKNRGRHPLIWALVLGLESSASTFFFMDEGTDSGDILSQEVFQIEYEDDAQSLYEKMTKLALEQIENFVPLLLNGSYPRVTQNNSMANQWRKRGPKDGLLDFRMSSRAIYNLVRALTRPYVGAHLEHAGREVKIWKVREIINEDSNIEPGKVIDVKEDTITLKCCDGAIEILEHEFKVLPQIGEYL